MSSKALFKKMMGKWRGECRTWFEPGQFADKSNVTGHIAEVFDGRFLRHTYESTIQGKPRRGEELIAYNSMTKTYQSSWIDDFHMNDAIMFSEGSASDGGFILIGQYDTAPNKPKWHWRTEYELLDENHLTITAYNIHPEGMESKAVETIYHRIE